MPMRDGLNSSSKAAVAASTMAGGSRSAAIARVAESPIWNGCAWRIETGRFGSSAAASAPAAAVRAAASSPTYSWISGRCAVWSKLQ